MKIVIMSKGRSDTIAKRSLRLFPDALVCVGEDEAELYARHTSNLLVHPSEVTGTARTRNWILDNVDDPLLCMVDDDIHACTSRVGFKVRQIRDPAQVAAIVERAAICAVDAGIGVFGFGQGANPIHYYPYRPIVFNTWVGTVFGVTNRDLRFDERLTLHDDLDFCLQAMLRHRIVWTDNRYHFSHDLFKGHGGNAVYRSSERHQREIALIKSKWGGHVEVKEAKGTVRLVLHVDR